MLGGRAEPTCPSIPDSSAIRAHPYWALSRCTVTNTSPLLWGRQSGVSNLISGSQRRHQSDPLSPGGVPAEAVVGVDVGRTHIAIASTGRRTDNPRYVTRAQRNLRRKQKSLSRKQKGSNGLRPDALSPRRMNALPTAEAISSTRCLDGWLTKTKHHRVVEDQDYAEEPLPCEGDRMPGAIASRPKSPIRRSGR
jgi:hypothetical protein